MCSATGLLPKIHTFMAFKAILVSSSSRQFLGLALAELSNLLFVNRGEGKFSYASHQPTDMEFQRHSLTNCGKCTADMASFDLKTKRGYFEIKRGYKRPASNKMKNHKSFSFLNCGDNSEIMLILSGFSPFFSFL